MSHEIEIHENGQAAFVSAREKPWHRLGTVFDRPMTAIEALEAALLTGWNVRVDDNPVSSTVQVLSEDGVTSARIEVKDKFITYRTNPVTKNLEGLGTVGKVWAPIQNEETAAFLDALVDEADVRFETAGSLRGGRETFLMMKLPDAIQIGGHDQVGLYLGALNSHDGTSSFRAAVTPVRWVCANTVRFGLAHAKSTYNVRHTRNATQAIAEARAALEMTFKYVDAFQAEAERLLDQSYTLGQFEQLIAQVWPVTKASNQSLTNAAQRTATLRTLWDADTQANIHGTKWAAYNAVVEYMDHFAPARSVHTRAERALTGSGKNYKQSALTLLSA